MVGQNVRLNPLEARKRLLLAESELNRAQLAGDLAGLAAGVGLLASRACAIGSIASATAALVAALAAFRRGKAGDGGGKPSWLRSLLKGVRLVSTFWLAFRAQKRD